MTPAAVFAGLPQGLRCAENPGRDEELLLQVRRYAASARLYRACEQGAGHDNAEGGPRREDVDRERGADEHAESEEGHAVVG